MDKWAELLMRKAQTLLHSLSIPPPPHKRLLQCSLGTLSCKLCKTEENICGWIWQVAWEPLWVHHPSEMQGWGLVLAQTLNGFQCSPSTVLPLCLNILTSSPGHCSYLFIFLLVWLYHLTQKLCWHHTGLLVPALYTHLAITLTLGTRFTHLAPSLDYELLRAFFVFCSPCLLDSSIPAPFPSWKTHSASDKYVMSSRKMSLTFPVNVRHSLLLCRHHLWFMSLLWHSPCASVVYLLRHIFLNRLWTFSSPRSCMILLFIPQGWTQGLVPRKYSLAICWTDFGGHSLCSRDPLIHWMEN